MFKRRGVGGSKAVWAMLKKTDDLVLWVVPYLSFPTLTMTNNINIKIFSRGLVSTLVGPRPWAQCWQWQTTGFFSSVLPSLMKSQGWGENHGNVSLRCRDIKVVEIEGEVPWRSLNVCNPITMWEQCNKNFFGNVQQNFTISSCARFPTLAQLHSVDQTNQKFSALDWLWQMQLDLGLNNFSARGKQDFIYFRV